jgi:uncharacterized repeat protein (TIGR01451 family)
MSQRLSYLAIVTAVLIDVFFALTASAQAAPAIITKSFNPATVVLNGNSIATITVTNPNAVPLTNVQFSDTMPAGIDLITQTGGTCSTPATGGGIFSINPGTETFSSTSNVLAAGQSCTITVSVRGIVIGPHVNTTSQVTSSEAPPGAAASGTLTVIPGNVDLAVVKTPSASPYGTGLPITYTIGVSNAGPSAADGVNMTDIIPSGTTFVSATPSQGSCSGTTTVTCNLGTIATAAGATISLVLNLPSTPGPVSNTASVTSLNPDTNPANDVAMSSITVTDAAEIPATSPFVLMMLILAITVIGVMRLRA